MIRMTCDLFTQVSDSGLYGPFVILATVLQAAAL